LAPAPPFEASEYRTTRLHTALVLQISSHSRSVACCIVRLLHQLHGAFRSSLDCTFERFGIPYVTSHDGQHCLYTNRCSKENVPNNTAVEFSLGRLWISTLVQGRLNVERREYTSDDNVHGPESEASAGTGPRSYRYDYSPPWGLWPTSLTSSQIRIPYPQD